MRIRVTKNGPYSVSGDIPLIKAAIDGDDSDASLGWQEEERFHTGGGPYLLCRCGESSNKPFCDSTHYAIGFECEDSASKDLYENQAKLSKGPKLDLLDQKNLCAVARFCDIGMGTWQFVLRSDEPANLELARETAKKCPSGRLTAVTKDGKKLEPELDKEIYAVDDPNMGCLGPLWVKGGIEVECSDGDLYEVRNRMTLCRCGDSNNKPFCDSNHIKSKKMEIEEEH